MARTKAGRALNRMTAFIVQRSSLLSRRIASAIPPRKAIGTARTSTIAISTAELPSRSLTILPAATLESSETPKSPDAARTAHLAY